MGAWRKARLAARNGWRAYLKNMHLTEFLIYAPVVCAGSFWKPWELSGSLAQRFLAGLGLVALTIAYLPATLWYYATNPTPRRRTLQQRTRPWGWIFGRLFRHRASSDH